MTFVGTRDRPNETDPAAMTASLFDVVVCGSLNLDLVSTVPHLPNPGETLPATGLLRLPGGKGLNQAVAAARQCARVAMLGATGDDAEAALLRQVLREENVAAAAVATFKDLPTGLAIIHLADDAENAIVIHGGANAALTAAEVEQSFVPGKVHLAQLEVPMDAVSRFLTQARGRIRILNAAPALPDASVLFKELEILIVNEGELRVFADGPSLADAARQLLTPTLHSVIVTLGARGAMWIHADAEVYVPAARVEAIDTTGAGDCFCGVLAARLAEGSEMLPAIEAAVAAAGESVQSLGAIAAMPRRSPFF